MKFQKNYIYAIIFIIIQTFTIIRNLGTGFIYFFWLCDFVSVFFAIFFILKKYEWVKSFVYIALIPQTLYLISMIYGVFTGTYAFIENITYVNEFYLFTSTLTHLSSILAFIFTINIKPQKKQLTTSFIFILMIYLVTLLFTSADYYVNYVYSQEDILPFTIPLHTYLWPLSTFILVVLPAYALQKLFYKLSNKNK